jgi:DNA invertase Pin-like site-specific DNA recombinase
VKPTSRPGPSLSNLLRIMETLQSRHLDSLSESEGLGFSTASDKLKYQSLAAFREFACDPICERVRCERQAPSRPAVDSTQSPGQKP